MTIADEVFQYLSSHPGGICDDCLTEVLHLKYRQQAFSRCSNLNREGLVLRIRDGSCRRCSKSKICTMVAPKPSGQVGTRPMVPTAPNPHPRIASVPVVSKPWFWEGNVQRVLVGWLQGSGWSIQSTANTAAKSPGKDIVAVQRDRHLWVSVKGYPEGLKKTNPSTQARHWFSHAVFDLIRYRSEHADVELAIGLPDRGVTYAKLAARSLWAFKQLPARIYWVSEAGSVTEEAL